MLFCANIFAQSTSAPIEHRDRPGMTWHFSYLGISFNNSINDFRRYLKGEGYSFIDDNPNTEGYLSAFGAIAGIKNTLGLDINYDKKTKKVTGVSSYFYYNNKEEAKKKFATIIKNINDSYPEAIQSYYDYYDESRCFIQHFYWNVYSEPSHTLFGTISLRINIDPGSLRDNFSALLEYKDVPNCMVSEDIPYNLYDISNYVQPTYDDGKLFVDANQLVIYVCKGNLSGSVTCFSDDRLKIFDMLCNEYLDEKEKHRQLCNYLLSLPLLDGKSRCCTFDCFNNKEINYAMGDEIRKERLTERDEEYEAMTNQAKQITAKESSNSNGYGFGDMLMEIIFSKDEINYYKSIGTYDFLKGSMRGVMNSAGGNGGSYMDNLSPSQRAVIHEHDNGK